MVYHQNFQRKIKNRKKKNLKKKHKSSRSDETEKRKSKKKINKKDLKNKTLKAMKIFHNLVQKNQLEILRSHPPGDVILNQPEEVGTHYHHQENETDQIHPRENLSRLQENEKDQTCDKLKIQLVLPLFTESVSKRL